MEQTNATKRVAVIGAGVSGLVAAKYLRDANLSVTVFERGSQVGGIWVFEERLPPEPPYPNITPSTAEAIPPSLSGAANDLRYVNQESISLLRAHHAPAGPAYMSLKNNIPTCLMSFREQPWPTGSPDYTSHAKVLNYIQSFAETHELERMIEFNTRVSQVAKKDVGWSVETCKLQIDSDCVLHRTGRQHFDAVVVCTSHHSAQKVPDIQGLPDLKQKWPRYTTHSKAYRRAQDILGKRIVLVGNGASACDIAHDVIGRASKLYQVTKVNSGYIPIQAMPKGLERVGEMVSVEETSQGHANNGVEANSTSAPSMRVHLIDGQVLEDIHSIVLCTGYLRSYPFLSQYHDDHATASIADNTVIITDGSMMHNLHKDVFYIPQPTLSFVGIPNGATSLALFEYQAMAIAKFLTGEVEMPSEVEMRAEYQARLHRKGRGRKFHSLMSEEVDYVEDILKWLNRDKKGDLIQGYSENWLALYAKRQSFLKEVFSKSLSAYGQKPSGMDVLGICSDDSPSYRES